MGDIGRHVQEVEFESITDAPLAEEVAVVAETPALPQERRLEADLVLQCFLG